MKLHLLFLFSVFVFSLTGQDISTVYLFVGSYTNSELGEGITVYQFNELNGALAEVEKEGNLINASFLSVSPNRNYLYACTDTKLDSDGTISSFQIDSTSGKLTFLNKQTTGGRNPVHLIVDQTNTNIISANYTDAGVSVFKCNPDGSINPLSQLIQFSGSSINQARQQKAHIHSCNFSPDNNYVFAPDLGSDLIRTFSFKNDSLTVIDSLTVSTEKGSGPRHFTFHPNQLFAYCIQELNGTIAAYSYTNGRLKSIEAYSSYQTNQDEYSSADIHISPDGKFLYASNRHDENTISIFSINQTNGKLTLKGHQSTFGAIPRSFVIDPSGQFLIVANQKTNKLIVFKRNTESGLLFKTNVEIKVNSPASLKMVKYQTK